MTKKKVNVKQLITKLEHEFQSKVNPTEEAILNEITFFIRKLRGADGDSKDFTQYSAIELSQFAGSLATLKDSLADSIAKAYKKKEIEGHVLKLKKSRARTLALEELEDEGIKTTEANIKAKIEGKIFIHKVNLSQWEAWYERVIYVWRSVNSVLDVIDGRIRVLQSQRADVGTMEDSLDINLKNL